MRTNGWTGGQYSLWRALTGVTTAAIFAVGAFTLSSAYLWLVAVWFGIAAVAALAFAAGFLDRAAAVVVAVASVGLIEIEGAPIWDPALALPFLAHLFVPSAPFGSFAARGRNDPRGDWRYPEPLRATLTIAFSLLLLVVAIEPWLGTPGIGRFLDLRMEFFGTRWPLFVVAAAFPVSRVVPILGPIAVGLALVLLLPGLAAGVGIGFLFLLLLTVDPAWIPRRRADGPDRVFYDGDCGFCHRSIRVLLAEDPTGDEFRFAPRESAAFADALPAEVREGLPPSIVVVTAAGDVRLRSNATVRMLDRLGGVWRFAALLLFLVPKPLRELGYRAVAHVRHKIFPTPENACPLVPADLRARFLPGAHEELPA